MPTGTLYVPAYYNTPAVTNDFSPAVLFNYRTKLGSAAIPDFYWIATVCFINGLYKVDIKWYYVDTAETFDYSFSETINFKNLKLLLIKKLIVLQQNSGLQTNQTIPAQQKYLMSIIKLSS